MNLLSRFHSLSSKHNSLLINSLCVSISLDIFPSDFDAAACNPPRQLFLETHQGREDV